MKDNEIARLVNDLRDIAIDFSHSHQLRERIAYKVVPHLKEAPDVYLPIKQLFLQWWCTGMDDAEFFNRMAMLLPLTNEDLVRALDVSESHGTLPKKPIPDYNCAVYRREQNLPSPRTCSRCKLGPCAYGLNK